MDDIVTELSKPIWWISVVLAGIVINLLSAYLKSQIDRTLIGSLSWWREKSTKRQEQWALRINAIISNNEIKADEMHGEIVQRLQSVALMLQSIILLLLTLLISEIDKQLHLFVLLTTFGLSAFIFFASYLAFLKAATTRSALQEAQKKPTHPSSGIR